MENLFPKFIIEEDSLILSKVQYHKNLISDPEKVKGGGWFDYKNESKTFIFSGKSSDFGRAEIEDIKKCIKEGKVFTNMMRTHDISESFNFQYDTGSELIDLNPIS